MNDKQKETSNLILHIYKESGLSMDEIVSSLKLLLATAQMSQEKKRDHPSTGPPHGPPSFLKQQEHEQEAGKELGNNGKAVQRTAKPFVPFFEGRQGQYGNRDHQKMNVLNL